MRFTLSFLALLLLFGCGSTKAASPLDEKNFRGETLRELLENFDAFQQKYPGPFASSVLIGAHAPGPRFIVGCMVHGDETGCLTPLLEALSLLDHEKIHFDGSLLAFVGNRQAAQKGKRFLQQDLNRVFISSAPESTEKNRARDIMPWIEHGDLFLDLHQTIEPTDSPFFAFAFDEKALHWARYLRSAELVVTRSSREAFAADSLTATEYAQKHNVTALTFESSQKGMNYEAYKRDLDAILKGIEGLQRMGKNQNLNILRKMAAEYRMPRLLKRVAKQPFFDPKLQLNPGLRNFTVVEKNQELGLRPDGHPLLAPTSGYLLFPKYPRRDAQGDAVPPIPSDIFLILQDVKAEDFSRVKSSL